MPVACEDWAFLVVDDELSSRNLASRVLTKLGAGTIMTADSARQALASLQAEQPDIILCDLAMPDTDGILLLRQLAEAGVYSGIILVGDGDNRLLAAAESIARGHNLQVLGSVNKPLNPRELAVLLHKMQTYRERNERDRLDSTINDEELRALVEDGDGPRLVYLPKISLHNHSLIGAEALSRWPGISSGSSTSVLRTIGRIEALGLGERFSHQVFSQALGQAGAWRAEGLQMGISVNVFAGMLNQVNLPDQIVDLAHAEGLDPASVTLEVNEIRFEDECAAPMEILTRLRLRKVGLSLDDFGTGTSTFERLRQLPVTEIKVDRGIIQSAADDATSRAILESSVALARRLDLLVVAEGVEDEQTLELATRVGCNAAQGYLISPPIEGEAVADWASDWQSGHNLQSAATVVAEMADALD